MGRRAKSHEGSGGGGGGGACVQKISVAKSHDDGESENPALNCEMAQPRGGRGLEVATIGVKTHRYLDHARSWTT